MAEVEACDRHCAWISETLFSFVKFFRIQTGMRSSTAEPHRHFENCASYVFFTRTTIDSIDALKRMNRVLFPITYGDAFYAKILGEANSHSFFMHDADACIGVCSLSVDNGHAYLMTFGLLPAYRGHGLGSQCLRVVEGFVLNELGRMSICLHVQTNNLKAYAFYTKNGYTLSGVEESYYSNIWPSSAFILSKQLLLQRG